MECYWFSRWGVEESDFSRRIFYNWRLDFLCCNISYEESIDLWQQIHRSFETADWEAFIENFKDVIETQSKKEGNKDANAAAGFLEKVGVDETESKEALSRHASANNWTLSIKAFKKRWCETVSVTLYYFAFVVSSYVRFYLIHCWVFQFSP